MHQRYCYSQTSDYCGWTDRCCEIIVTLAAVLQAQEVMNLLLYQLYYSLNSSYVLSLTTGSTSCYISGDHKQVPKPQAMSTFEFLDRNYAVETPSCLLPAVNELFKNISERYDIAVTNREKVDEALQLFKKVLEVESTLPISDCFTAWRSQLSNPKFTVTRSDTTGDVKQITVRAEEVPRLKRKAQKHIRDLLDACHLFLQQRDFLKREIQTSLNELDQISKNVPMLCKETKSLSSLEKKSMPQVVKRAKEQFSQFPGTIDRFWNQIFGLLCEINASVHILEDE